MKTVTKQQKQTVWPRNVDSKWAVMKRCFKIDLFTPKMEKRVLQMTRHCLDHRIRFVRSYLLRYFHPGRLNTDRSVGEVSLSVLSVVTGH